MPMIDGAGCQNPLSKSCFLSSGDMNVMTEGYRQRKMNLFTPFCDEMERTVEQKGLSKRRASGGGDHYTILYTHILDFFCLFFSFLKL